MRGRFAPGMMRSAEVMPEEKLSSWGHMTSCLATAAILEAATITSTLNTLGSKKRMPEQDVVGQPMTPGRLLCQLGDKSRVHTSKN